MFSRIKIMNINNFRKKFQVYLLFQTNNHLKKPQIAYLKFRKNEKNRLNFYKNI